MSGVLVTGASGFVGLPVLQQLARAGAEVHALSTRERPPEVPGVSWHRADLAAAAAVDRLIEELAPERLVHLAWCTEHGRFWSARENLSWVQSSLGLVSAFARHGGRRMVILGTCAEYDWSSVGPCLSESASPVAPATLYGVAKDALRRVTCAYCRQEGIELAWGRLFFLYGPREVPGRLVPSVIRALLAGQPIATGANGHLRDFMFVEDVAAAVVALLDSPVVGAVNIASGVPVTVGQVIELIVQLVGRPGLVQRGARPDRPDEPPVLVADVARLRDEVGFRASWELADGLAATVRWWQGRDRLPGGAPR
jgi:nucleoside-diphosphate-sugar epimerase